MKSIHLTLDLIRIEGEPESRSGLRCPGCTELLMLHQPDEQSPDHLLGTCPQCGAWFVLHAVAGLLVRLPGKQDLRAAWAASGGASPGGPPGD